ncbi:hypothetical protein QQ991_07885 [Weizmannia coagulans]|jgi:hypothetical protein|uniref:Uncharacterized protein n=3 Tax=Heyndrickxia TaxID=2837504 RepID=G2TLD6_HEYCO|nr:MULTISPECIES: hypothetical protein [Heyndrickxia]NWN93845.1 hypothetical protein [Bacillus sp. (in: firmicutes)]AEO99438.1 hypothetical protein Bcoa_0213 [Heyndrickxia coagulans 36D1]AJO23552.1 hypothetical protein SB48_HM08orf04394 [Heyndrickxia coagulans]AKN54949.1 hypothetical protein AB434_2544 [Heyndrickxia coagulans]APB35746.1 hypothetical protein BIZ35_02305 [Heyndrickxia coagulans]
MKQVISSVKRKPYERKRIAVLRMELDYELATLYEAMEMKDEEQKGKSIKRLEKIREELLKMKAM